MPTFPLHSHRAATACVAATFIGLGVAMFAGCASGPSATATGEWQDKTALPQPFSRVITVAVSKDINQRCRFERLLASRIDGAGTKAVASCDAVEKRDPLTLESIEAAVAELKADGVIATKLVTFEWESASGGSRDTRGSLTAKATGAGWGVYGVPVVYGELQHAGPITTMQGDATVTTKVWSTQGPTLVYTMDSRVHSFESSDQGLATLVTPMVARLKRDGLIR